MNGFRKKLSSIEINLAPTPNKDFLLAIDGKKLHGVRNVQINSGVDVGIPIVKIEFYAKEITGKVKGKMV